MADEPIDDESTTWPIGLEKCPVCFDTFINGLRLQPACRHPICIACLRKIVNENTPNEKRCPLCREDFTHLADQLGDLPTAEYFDNLLSSSRDISEPSWPESPNLVGKPVMCDWCPDNEAQSADWHCYQCCQFLCKKCFDRHKKGRCTNDHDVYRFKYILQKLEEDRNRHRNQQPPQSEHGEYHDLLQKINQMTALLDESLQQAPARIEGIRRKIGEDYAKASEQIGADCRRLTAELNSGLREAKRCLTVLRCLIRYCENVHANGQREKIDNMLRQLNEGSVLNVDLALRLIAVQFRPTDRERLMPCHIVGRLMNASEVSAAPTDSDEFHTWDELNTELLKLREERTKLKDMAELIDERNAAGNNLMQPVDLNSHSDDPVTHLQCSITELVSLLDQREAELSHREQILREQESTIVCAQEQIMIMINRVSEVEEMLTIKTDEVCNLTQRLSLAENERDHLNDINLQLRARTDNLQQEYRNLRQVASELASRLRQSEAEKAQKQDELQRTIATFKAQLDVAGDEAENLRQVTQRQRLQEARLQQQLRLCAERETESSRNIEHLKKCEFESQRTLHKITKSRDEARQELRHLTAVRAVPGTDPVHGVATLHNRLYVIRASSNRIEVYDVPTFRRIDYIWLKQQNAVADMTSCAKNECLYVADRGVGSGFICRVDVTSRDLNQSVWAVSGIPQGVSVTQCELRHVMVTCLNSSCLTLFTTRGEFVRQVDVSQSLTEGLVIVRHAVQLAGGWFIAICGGSNAAGVHYTALIKDDGREIVRKFDECYQPTHLAVDVETGNIFVSDSEKRMVFVINSEFKLVRRIESFDVSGPRTLFVDANSRCLYVAETGGHVMIYGLRKHAGVQDNEE